MGLKIQFVAGLLIGLCLAGCAGMTFKYYGISEDVDFSRGKLLGPEQKDDIPFAECAPNATTKSPCVVIKAPVFYAMKQDYDDCKMRLEECERSCAGRTGD